MYGTVNKAPYFEQQNNLLRFLGKEIQRPTQSTCIAPNYFIDHNMGSNLTLKEHGTLLQKYNGNKVDCLHDIQRM